MSKNFHNKNSRYKMDSYTPLMVSLMVILLFTVAIICYHYAKHRSKGKHIALLTKKKWKIVN